MDKDKSGVVDYTEFCEVLQVDPSPLCERVFRLYDYDKTGQIDAREVNLMTASPLTTLDDEFLTFLNSSLLRCQITPALEKKTSSNSLSCLLMKKAMASSQRPN